MRPILPLPTSPASEILGSIQKVKENWLVGVGDNNTYLEALLEHTSNSMDHKLMEMTGNEALVSHFEKRKLWLYAQEL